MKRVFKRENLHRTKNRLLPWGVSAQSTTEINFIPDGVPDQESFLYDQKVMEKFPNGIGYLVVAPPNGREMLFPGIPRGLLAGVETGRRGFVELKRYIKTLSRVCFKNTGTMETMYKLLHAVWTKIAVMEAESAKRRILERSERTFIREPNTTTFLLNKRGDGGGIIVEEGQFPNRETIPIKGSEEIGRATLFYRRGSEKEKDTIPQELQFNLEPGKWLRIAPKCMVYVKCPYCKEKRVVLELPTYDISDKENSDKSVEILKMVEDFADHLITEHEGLEGITSRYPLPFDPHPKPELITIPKYKRTRIIYTILRSLKMEIFHHLYGSAEENREINAFIERR